MLPGALVCPFLIRSNQKWTSQKNWQHSEKTKEAIKKDKPEQLAT
jgi:hypothetical protein